MQKIKLSSFIVLLNLSKFFEKMLSKHDPLLTDNISVNFEICMLPIQMKGSSAIQEKKNFTSQLGLMLVAVHWRQQLFSNKLFDDSLTAEAPDCHFR